MSRVLLDLFHFRFDGLDLMEIIQLKLSYTFKKRVKYHFKFRQLKATASPYHVNALLNLQKLGLKIGVVGQGPLELTLNNLSLQGSFKYRAPIAIGSSKIYKFNIVVTLDSVTSNIGGIFGDGSYNEFFNKQIEILIPEIVQKYEAEISKMIEENLVPRVNKKLKGKKIWTFLALLGSSKHKCKPTPAPWLLAHVADSQI